LGRDIGKQTRKFQT